MAFTFWISPRQVKEWAIDRTNGLVIRAGTDEYHCLHEAGHAQAAYLTGARVLFIHMDGPVPGAEAMSRVDWSPIWPPTAEQRQQVACGGHAAEHALFAAGRVRDEFGGRFTPDSFRTYSLRNSDQDMTRFFLANGAQLPVGAWTPSRAAEYSLFSRKNVQPKLRRRLSGVLNLARALGRYRKLDHDAIEAALAGRLI